MKSLFRLHPTSLLSLGIWVMTYGACSSGMRLESKLEEERFATNKVLKELDYMVIEGTVKDKNTGAPIPFATLRLLNQKGDLITGATSHFDGRYYLVLEPGKWREEPVDLQVETMGYQEFKMTNIPLNSGKCTIGLTAYEQTTPATIWIGNVDHFDLSSPGNSGAHYDSEQINLLRYHE